MEEIYDLLDEDFSTDGDGENVALESIDLQSSYLNEFLLNVEFPILVIEGITTEEEINYFRKNSEGKDSTLPMYCLIEGAPMKVCDFCLTLDSLLTIKSIYSYKIKLLRSRDDEVQLDLNDPSTLCKFIKL